MLDAKKMARLSKYVQDKEKQVVILGHYSSFKRLSNSAVQKISSMTSSGR